MCDDVCHVDQDGIISPETDSGFVGSENICLPPAAVHAFLHQRAPKRWAGPSQPLHVSHFYCSINSTPTLTFQSIDQLLWVFFSAPLLFLRQTQAVSGPQEGNTGKAHSIPVAAACPSQLLSHKHMNTEPCRVSKPSPDRPRRSEQVERRHSYCSPHHCVSWVNHKHQTNDFGTESGNSESANDTLGNVCIICWLIDYCCFIRCLCLQLHLSLKRLTATTVHNMPTVSAQAPPPTHTATIAMP